MSGSHSPECDILQARCPTRCFNLRGVTYCEHSNPFHFSSLRWTYRFNPDQRRDGRGPEEGDAVSRRSSTASFYACCSRRSAIGAIEATGSSTGVRSVATIAVSYVCAAGSRGWCVRDSKSTVLLGYESGTGEPVWIPLHHLTATGLTQLSGKTTTPESLIRHSGRRAIAFRAKSGESDIQGDRQARSSKSGRLVLR